MPEALLRLLLLASRCRPGGGWRSGAVARDRVESAAAFRHHLAAMILIYLAIFL
jgi:hypothetical protein